MTKVLRERLWLAGFPLCIRPSHEWAHVELREYYYQKSVYVVSSDEADVMRGQEDILATFYHKYEGRKQCSLFTLCCGIKKECVRVFPDFHFPLLGKSAKMVLE